MLLLCRGRERPTSELRDLEQQPIGMVPGVAGDAVRRRRKSTVRQRPLSAELSFEFDAVTGCAVVAIELLA
jgi:hypothetical protein